MNPYTTVAWCLIAAIVAAVLPYLIGRRALARKRHLPELLVPERDIYGEIADSSALKAARERFRDGDTITPRVDREIGAHPALGVGYGRLLPGEAIFDKHGRRIDRHDAFQRTKSIFLTARELETVNAKRRLAGKQPLNRAGFSNAVSHAWGQPRRQPDTRSDWLTYLIVYECLFADHTASRVDMNTGITITPDAPYNGHGGEFAGAGASGDWTSPGAQALGAAGVGMGVGAALDQAATADVSQDTPPVRSEPSAPSYTPDPTPSYDPGPSYNSGSSSSSYDSGSSSSGGGDGS